MYALSGFLNFRHKTILLLSLLGLCSLNPFFIWKFSTELRALVLALLIPLFFLENKIYLWRIMIGFFIGSVGFFYFYLVGNSIFGCTYSFAFLFLIYQFDKESIVQVYSVFKSLFTLTLIPGLVLWLYHYTTGDFLAFSIGQIEPILNEIKENKGQVYIVYPLAVVLDHMVSGAGYRFFGPYDEPGVVGTFSALFLISERLDFKKFENLILLVCGALTFSLAFYILVSFAYLFFLLKRPVYIVPLLALLLLVPIVSKTEIFQERITHRLQISSDGFSGDNRSSEALDSTFNNWIASDASVLFLGVVDYGKTSDSSWKQIPVRTGILGGFMFLTVLAFFVFRFLRVIDFYTLIFIMAFLASIYQRPNVITPAYLILLAAGVAYVVARPAKNTVRSTNEGA